jgi:hypothetical protein
LIYEGGINIKISRGDTYDSKGRVLEIIKNHKDFGKISENFSHKSKINRRILKRIIIEKNQDTMYKDDHSFNKPLKELEIKGERVFFSIGERHYTVHFMEYFFATAKLDYELLSSLPASIWLDGIEMMLKLNENLDDDLRLYVLLK